MLVPVPLGAVCVLTGGDSGEVDGKLENALVCELVDPKDPLPDVASAGDSVLALPMPPGDACFGGAENTLDDVRLDEVRLDDPPPLLAGCPTIVIGVAIATCGEWNKGAAVPCVDDEVADGG
ncbi:hypothetical protein DYGSA30_09540 [Dyella sp. GSA-30]|nr:hypothetical protein DYGSA30_09540 [Dyella sp. GSA-30]